MGGLAPRSSCPGGELHSSPGRSLIWLTAKSTLYRKGKRFQRLPTEDTLSPGGTEAPLGGVIHPACVLPPDALGQFWRTETGQFWSAPKSGTLDRALNTWNQAWGAQDEALAMDGKTMKNAVDETGSQTHIMSVAGHKSKHCYAQKK